MDSLIFVASNCFAVGFGCGWWVSWYFGSTQGDCELSVDNSRHPTTTFLNPIPVIYRLPRASVRRHQKCKRRRNQRYISDKKKEQRKLVEAFKEHTNSIENLDATLTILNETLKKSEIVERGYPRSTTRGALSPKGRTRGALSPKGRTRGALSPKGRTRGALSPKGRKTVEMCETEIACDVVENETDICHQESSLKDSGWNIQSRILQPEFGRGCKDKSASMHIYDANFEAPKCNENPWTLKPSDNDVINENLCKGEHYNKYLTKSDEPTHLGEENPSVYNELSVMFQDCKKGESIKTPSSSVLNTQHDNRMLTKPGGGYASMGELNKTKKEVTLAEPPPRPKKRTKGTGTSEGSVKSTISRGDELDIINSFSSMKGMGWEEAVNTAQEQGYNLHATYINNLPNYKSEYSKTVLGVKVKDISFDCSLGSDHKGFGKEAVVTAVIDVGGQDTHGRA